MQQTLIRLTGLSYQYPKTQVNCLTDINLSIESGEYLAIQGTSGSGKSTLLSILGLINQPTQGEYYLLGTATSNLTNQSIASLKNREIGFIFQNFHLVSYLNALENVMLPAKVCNITNPKEKAIKLPENHHKQVTKALTHFKTVAKKIETKETTES